MSGIETLKAFAKSPHHAWLMLVTLGAGAATVSGIGMLAGAALYALGWIYLPDSGLFKRWLAARKGNDEEDKLKDFLARRKQIHESLRQPARRLYDDLARDIASLQQEFERDDRLDRTVVQQRNERLSNLAWTYLRLLHTGEMLDRFIESEDPAALESQIQALEKKIAAIPSGGQSSLAESLQARLGPLKSRLEKRLAAADQRQLTSSELQRISELVMLYRADHLASRDGAALSHEIDGAAFQLDRTRDWLRDLEFDTSPSDIPSSVTAAAPLKVGGGSR